MLDINIKITVNKVSCFRSNIPYNSSVIPSHTTHTHTHTHIYIYVRKNSSDFNYIDNNLSVILEKAAPTVTLTEK